MFFVDGKEIPETLEEVLVPSRTAHIVIDLQNDCCLPEGALARAGGDVSSYPGVIERVSHLVEHTRRLGVLQVFVKLVALPNGRSDSPSWIWLRRRMSVQYGGEKADAKNPVRFCIKGTWGAEIVDALDVRREDLVVEKHRSSAFFGTNLDMLLRSNGIQALIFTGCTTEGCVESSVRDAGFLDYFPVVVSDGVGSDVAELHLASLKIMKAYRADVITGAELLQVFEGVQPR